MGLHVPLTLPGILAECSDKVMLFCRPGEKNVALPERNGNSEHLALPLRFLFLDARHQTLILGAR